MSIENNIISIQMLIKGRELTLQQRGDAQQELDNLIQKIDQLEREVESYGLLQEEIEFFANVKLVKDKIKNLEKENKEFESLLIESAKYGYNYHINTSFPNKSFEENCLNNYLQMLVGRKGFTIEKVRELKTK